MLRLDCLLTACTVWMEERCATRHVELTLPPTPFGCLRLHVATPSGVPLAERLLFRRPPPDSINVDVAMSQQEVSQQRKCTLRVSASQSLPHVAPVACTAFVTVTDAAGFGLSAPEEQQGTLESIAMLETDLHDVPDIADVLSCEDDLDHLLGYNVSGLTRDSNMTRTSSLFSSTQKPLN